MKNIKFAHSLLAVVLGSVLISGSALAAENALAKTAESTEQKVDNSIDHAGKKIDHSLQSADVYLDDSAITAKVKGKLLEHKGINSNDISVKTEKGVVYLSGFVKNKHQAAKVSEIAHGVKGVKSVKSTIEIKK
ncbi:BON domain-containing protein [Xenorhabdus nematophila]|uniref:Osmotically-inducible protein Y n=1 Tax=Xenorhabdus nematophila (strain ATCC 19061 / DSM 3370 / CCUG 14189 / LMG 1036 / NCIMB 9965 / AN6) TaxID=406817 RepID=D3VB68_XENNA|nr:BON domain-containing protein [Xenorhabdus nematophila]CEE90594.1 Osmotically inducible protein Y [Xenorhabdus nematophila str. Anatoliense]CEF28771.1 Osmotically inducible protein Y [Xenorhabdus nematophila str. Websteri]AYA42303.1 BON domain-containing protein [Xenorhabdus nematophila]KHD29227.1 osmotically inducible protein Y [Xenorhabdus nematophila]MBA0021032.1 BON domain-containing protein [Xenorhabdus nematophila]